MRLNWSDEGRKPKDGGGGGCEVIVEVGKILGPLAAGGESKRACVPGASRQQRRGLGVVSYRTISRACVTVWAGYACIRDA